MTATDTITVQLNDSWNVNLYFAPDCLLLVSETRLRTLVYNGNAFANNHFEVITFPPGTYYHVFRDGIEIHPDTDLNLWLKNQACVGCRFNLSTKKPSVIKAHIKSCVPRAAFYATHHGEVDPLKQVCEWMSY